MRTRTVCGVCFDEVATSSDGLYHRELDRDWDDYHEPHPITVRVCEAGTCENLADVIHRTDDYTAAYCSNHALTWAVRESFA